MEPENAHQIQDFPYYEGPHAIQGIKFRAAGRELGVKAWGMTVLEIDPGCNDSFIRILANVPAEPWRVHKASRCWR